METGAKSNKDWGYTIDLFGHKSDIVERELFSDIDFSGSKAMDVIVKAPQVVKHIYHKISRISGFLLT